VYTLDTNIIIYYFNGEAPILAFLREQMEQGAPLFISAGRSMSCTATRT
jgi:predicted nucleic acid-binding protein